MLKPKSSHDLALATPDGATSYLLPATSPTWNPLTPIEQLPVALAQLRETQRRIDKLVQDAENQVVHFLRFGPLGAHQAQVKELIERFYPFTEWVLRTWHARLNANIVNENLHVSCNVAYSFWKGFTPDWGYIASYRPVALAALEKRAGNWQWDKLAANPLVDWTTKSIQRHFRQLKEHFTPLSANTGIAWTPELLRAFAPHWDYSTDGLLGNEALPWEDEDLPQLLLAIAPEEAELDEDEVAEVATDMCLSTFQRRSLNRHRLWTAELLRQHLEELDWNRLSANPALPFSFSLLAEFADYWDWSELAANPGFYEKLLAPLLSDNVVHEYLQLTVA